jgi:hypothetical protein
MLFAYRMSSSITDKKNFTHNADMTAIPKSIPYSNKEFIISFMLIPSIFQSCSANPGVPHPSAATSPALGCGSPGGLLTLFFA